MPDNEVDSTDGEVTDSPGEYIRQDPLIRLFGDHAKARMVVVLLSAHPRPLNPTDIIEQADLGSRKTWYDYKDELLATGLVEKTGSAGNSPLYGIAEDAADRLEWLEKVRDFTGAELRESGLDENDE